MTVSDDAFNSARFSAQNFLLLGLLLICAGCSSLQRHGSSAPATSGGGYYLNDGPGENPPPNLDQIPDAVPKIEQLKLSTMRPYTVLGQTYTPMTALAPYKERGIASWYGRRYHGEKTSSGEIYDMYGMTAAHTILPIPSYARVTNLANGKSVVVRVNDRGPFHSDRLIDLSYTAAYKLGVLAGGKAMVEVETIIPGQPLPPPAVVAVPDATPAAAPVVEPPVPSFDPATIAPAVEEAVVKPVPPPVVPITTTPAQAAPDTPAMPTPIAKPSAPVAPQGVFLQFGAFASEKNAASYLGRLQTQVDGALATTLHVYEKSGLFRVQAGPYANRDEARQTAEHLNQGLGLKAVVITR